jgi:hypothetical protein
MPIYFNRTRGPLPLELRSGSCVVPPKGSIDIAPADEGSASVVRYVKKGLLIPPRIRPAPAPKPAPAPAPKEPKAAPVAPKPEPKPEPKPTPAPVPPPPVPKTEPVKAEDKETSVTEVKAEDKETTTKKSSKSTRSRR